MQRQQQLPADEVIAPGQDHRELISARSEHRAVLEDVAEHDAGLDDILVARLVAIMVSYWLARLAAIWENTRLCSDMAFSASRFFISLSMFSSAMMRWSASSVRTAVRRT